MIQLLLQLFEDGGWIIWPILGVSVLGLYIGFGKMILIARIRFARKRFLRALAEKRGGKQKSTGFVPYDILLNHITGSAGRNTGLIGNNFREFMLDVMPSLEGGLSTMAMCVSVAPLLGLLGTITGMNRMFDVINEFGLGSPALMADGISIALEATLCGLTVAVAVMFLHNFLVNRKESLVSVLYNDAEDMEKRFQPELAAGGAL